MIYLKLIIFLFYLILSFLNIRRQESKRDEDYLYSMNCISLLLSLFIFGITLAILVLTF